ncbi:MAG: NAD(P)-dependent oxidoreductase [Pseudomonadota bacterium]
MKNSPKIALLGTGLMGFPMAKNILAAGYRLKVWNRSLQKAAPLGVEGALVCDNAADAVREADIVVTMLTNGAVVNDLLFVQHIAESMTAGTMLVDMSSIKPAEAKDNAARLDSMGIKHLDAPVSGGTKGAEAGTLAIMAGGDAEVFEAAKPVLSAMGRAVRVGPAGAGQLAKLANQAIVGIAIGAVSEAMLMAQKGGADPAAIRDALKGGFADSTILQQHGERMTSGNFEPGGLSSIQLKDMNNILEEAESLGLQLPLSEHIRDRYKRLCEELNGGDKDHSGLYLELCDRNSTQPFSS